MQSWKKYLAEGIGTFVLTFVGCGVAAFTGANLVGTALAFGLAIVAMAYIIGPISGCHVNPAVSLALFLNKKLSAKDFGFYVLSQFVGGLVAGAALFLVTYYVRHTGAAGLGANAIQPALMAEAGTKVTAASYIAAFLAEAILTGIFVLTILGVTSKEENGPVTGLVIGGSLTFVHLLGLALTGTSVNPARSFGPAIFAMIHGNYTPAIQLWIFLLAPAVGAALAALLFKYVLSAKEAK